MNSTASLTPRAQDHATSVRRKWLSVASHLDPKYGGIAAMLPELCTALQSDGASTARLLGMCGDSERERVPELMRDSTSTVASSRLGWMFDSTWRQQFAAHLASADVVHIHGLWEEHCVSAARVARMMKKPYMISAHGMLEKWALQNKRAKKLVYAALIEKPNINGAACLHALTVAEAEDYRRFGAKNPIAIIPNAVRVPSAVTAALFFEEFPQLRGRRLVLYLGRIHYKKGLDLLARSWRQVAGENADAHLVIAGPDFENTREIVARQVTELGIGERVTFTGMLSGPMKWSALAASELFVLPSYSEGFSMSVLEAMGMGKPVIVTRQCNVPEVAEYDCGMTIEPDVAELNGALLAALGIKPERRREMGKNGMALVQKQFSWDSVGGRMRGVYEWILAGSRGGDRPSDVVLFE